MIRDKVFNEVCNDIAAAKLTTINPSTYDLLVTNGNSVHHGKTPSGRNIHSFTEIIDELVVDVTFAFKQYQLTNTVDAEGVVNVYTNDGRVAHFNIVDANHDLLSRLTNYDEIAVYKKLIDSIGDRLHADYYADLGVNNNFTWFDVKGVVKRGLTLCTELKTRAFLLDRCSITRTLVVVNDDAADKASAVDALLAAREVREALFPWLVNVNTFEDVLREFESWGVDQKVRYVDNDYLIVECAIGDEHDTFMFIKDESGRPLLLSNYRYRNLECCKKLNNKLNKFFNINAEVSYKRMHIVNHLSNNK